MKKQILYIFVRNDLPSMNAGKAMAQASHASAQFVNILSNDKTEMDKNYFDEWLNEGEGFGTTIVLEGSLENIKKILYKYSDDWWQGDIIDVTYPFKAQKELLELMDDYNMAKYNINICADASVDKYGMIQCTRNEHTCSWLFLTGEDETFEKFKQECDEYNIKLHR